MARKAWFDIALVLKRDGQARIKNVESNVRR
jgi:hypothetical protein